MGINQFFNRYKTLLIYGVPLLLYAVVLSMPIPRQVGLSLRYDFTVVVLILLVIIFLVFSIPGKWGQGVGLLLTLLLFGLPLSGLWASGKSEFGIVEGLLPWSDANGYYMDAQRLLDGMLFSGFSGRRPLFPGMLATILGITGQNLMITLGVLVAITAFACYLASREIQRTHGTMPGVLMLIGCFLFYRRYAGMTLTENLGLALGALAFALLWHGTDQKRPWWILFALFALTLGLNARAGAFLILPVLLLWVGRFLHEKHLFSYKFLGIGAGFIFLGFLINYLLGLTLVAPGANSFSNFSYTLYGQAVGGKGWLQAEKDFPELKQLPEEQRSSRVYELALEEIKSRPANLAKGVWGAWVSFFRIDDLGAYGFVGGENETINRIVRVGLFALTLAGILLACIRRRDGLNSMLLASTVGIFLSIPFVPPGDADHMRAYAVTIPFLFILPAMGVAAVLKLLKARVFLQTPSMGTVDQSGLFLGIILVLLVVVGPLVIRVIRPLQPRMEVTCPAGMSGVEVRLTAGSYVMVVDDSQKTWLPSIRWNEFIQNAHDHPDWLVTNELDSAHPGSFLMSTLDLISGSELWLIAERNMIPAMPSVVRVCGEWSKNRQAKNYGFFYARSIKLAENY